eukprot:SAG22_NODE_249_length_13894_cov_60.455455_13_plen_142_part_00
MQPTPPVAGIRLVGLPPELAGSARAKLDVAVLAGSDHFIAHCPSSFSHMVARLRNRRPRATGAHRGGGGGSDGGSDANCSDERNTTGGAGGQCAGAARRGLSYWGMPPAVLAAWLRQDSGRDMAVAVAASSAVDGGGDRME